MQSDERAAGRDEVAVWWLPTQTAQADDMSRWFAMLDADEQSRAARFHFDADRRDYVAAHAMLRALLSARVNAPRREWRFIVDDGGKPRIDPPSGAPALRFSLSHTRGLAAAAVAARGSIGVDAERIDSAKADMAIADAYFAPSEVRMLRAAPSAERTDSFFRLWTLKEAYLKATAEGVGVRLDSFAFSFDADGVAFSPPTGARRFDWQFVVLPTSPDHAAALAVGRESGPPLVVASRELTPQDL
jgi:4'-phosphopantetheinyl transferase